MSIRNFFLMIRGVLIFFLAINCLLGFSQTVFDSIRCEHRLSLLKKKAAILNTLHLTESQKSSFWPVYESYEMAIEFVESEYSFLLWKYQHQSAALSDKEHHELAAQIMEDEYLIAKIRKQYFKKFSKAVTAEQVSTFMLLDLTERQTFHARILEWEPSVITAALR